MTNPDEVQPDRPVSAILRFEVGSGDYWDGPSTGIGQAVGLLRVGTVERFAGAPVRAPVAR